MSSSSLYQPSAAERGAQLGRLHLRLQELMANDPELARNAPDPRVLATLRETGRSSIEIVEAACNLYGDRPCLGSRAQEVHTDGDGAARVSSVPRMEHVTFARLWERVTALASGWTHARLLATGDRLGICGFASVDWVVTDLACLYLAAVSVPLQSHMRPADLELVINDAELRVIVCTVEQLDAIEPVLPRCPNVEAVVLMDLHPEETTRAASRVERLRAGRPDIAVTTLIDLEARGRAAGRQPKVGPAEVPGSDGNPLRSLVYTSGSTGRPKGAMFPERLWHSIWSSFLHSPLPELPLVTLNFMPLNHTAGRIAVFRGLARGGLTCFVHKSDMSTLFEDIRLTRPTTMNLVPRVSAMIYQHFQSEVIRRGGHPDAGAADGDPVAQQVMEEMAGTFLGDRLLIAETTSAPTAPAIHGFLERVFRIPIFNVYGATEYGAVTMDGRVLPRPNMEFKLVDAPELGYRTTDTPHPRGELRIKFPGAISGYYKNPAATAELFDEEGYLRTGDIVEQRGPGELIWLDRQRDIIKLAQGEFVSISRLETMYGASSPFIHQIHVYGNSERSHVLAVVVPNMADVEARLSATGLPCTEGEIKQLLRSEINRIANEQKVPAYEVPRDFLVEREPFSKENGLLTESNKPARHHLKEAYGARLEAMYAAIEAVQEQELRRLRLATADAGVAERVRRAMEATLGLTEIDVRERDQSFIQFGGDSLSAVRLAALVQELCGVAVPVGIILDPTSSLHGITRYVEDAVSGGGHRSSVSFEQVHGAGADRVLAGDLRIDRFLSPEERVAAENGRPATESAPAHFLLTGANGFLGRFLLLELLERAARKGGKVHCLVRARGDDAAAERLAASFSRRDPELSGRFGALARDHLVVHAGDLLEPHLGLTQKDCAALGDVVDCIVHNGALVNHVLNYAQLFEPNVLGTAEVIRLALARRTPVNFISSVSVATGPRRGSVGEHEDAQQLWPARPVDGGYAVGYGTSKWAGELLLADAHARYGLPVNVFRCGMILGHSAYAGEVNASDSLTRLLCGILYTRTAPRSFFSGGSGPASHFDGVPVDFAAAAIAAIAAGGVERPAHAIYHVSNSHWDDGISLDKIVDWVESAGYAIARIDDYGQWLAQFRERLMALDEPLRSRSPLALLHRWANAADPESSTRLTTDRLRQRLRDVQAPVSDSPKLSEAFIHRCLRSMVDLGLVDPPAA